MVNFFKGILGVVEIDIELIRKKEQGKNIRKEKRPLSVSIISLCLIIFSLFWIITLYLNIFESNVIPFWFGFIDFGYLLIDFIEVCLYLTSAFLMLSGHNIGRLIYIIGTPFLKIIEVVYLTIMHLGNSFFAIIKFVLAIIGPGIFIYLIILFFLTNKRINGYFRGLNI